MSLSELIHNSVASEVLHPSDEYDLIVWKHITEDELTDDNRSMYTLNNSSYSGTEIKYTKKQYISEDGNVIYENMITSDEYMALDEDEKEIWKRVRKFYGRVPIPISEMENICNVFLVKECLNTFRLERNRKLDATDKYTIPDWPHTTPEKKQEWLIYRQALRDLPVNTEDPLNPVWPVPPE
jgi:hypothetical protein